MLFLWDYLLAGLVFVFFALLTWVLLWPHGESWIPEELRQD
jgi:hypothetical protein